ncbi:hypothetical protein EKE94_16370 [Mesobaculum littorinae]|uniref:Ceramidase n=1 Tax=Mesobaculum littorinae TaxID=2486419 RepID=A0A438ADZ6_9RHOB|nr:ceramidase domain-containing protein [Mesobaculum littorinae]RVV96914.1 hypothetical protein EKE94_16370 [Mesobaculum littorinae]
MDWTRQIDGYCERLGPGYWAEPVNAVTNAAFVIAALILWRRSRGVPMARGMAAVLGVIGVGSFLFHTHATAWASLADVLPILGFILLYIFAANRRFWNMPPWAALLGTLAFLPYAAALTPVLRAIPGIAISAVYWPVPLLIAAYAVALRRRSPATARGLGLGAALLTLSLTFRSLDMPLCEAWPLGTHPMWHILNAVMLGWMIEVYLRHSGEDHGGHLRGAP